MNESNRRIASLNRIDELNQRVAFQNDPLIAAWAAKTVPREPKTHSRRLKRPPRFSKEGPRAPKSGPRLPQDGPRTPPRGPLGTVFGLSWDHPITQSKTRPPRVDLGTILGYLFASKIGPKATPSRLPNHSKINTKKASVFFYRSWTRLGRILRGSWAPP